MTFTSRFRSLTRSFSQFNLFASRFCPAAGTRPRGAVLRLHPGLACLALIPAVLLLSASASAQVTYTGTAATQNFGSQAVGSAESPVTLNFSVAAGTTVGSIGVLTQGAPNLDFIDAGGGTCTAQAYASTTTCTMNVTFKPGHPGLRMGAVVFFSESGNAGIPQGQVLIYGNGTGPQVTFANTTTGSYQPSTATTLGSKSASYYWGVAVDATGNVFVNTVPGGHVFEILAAGGYTTIKLIALGLGTPRAMAVDGAGNVFVADDSNNAVYEILAANGYATSNAVGSGFNSPFGAAVDGAGNVFVADFGNNAVKEIVAAGGYTTIKTLGGGFFQPSDVAVDGNGNVFLVSFGFGNPVQEIPASCIAGANDASCVLTLGGDFGSAFGIALDSAGNVFVADDAVYEVLAAGGYSTVVTLGNGLNGVSGVAVDGSGNVYVAENGNLTSFLAEKLDFADPPTVNFPTPTGIDSVDTTDGTQTVTVSNDGNAPLAFSGVAYPFDFIEPNGDANACTGSTYLGAGLACDLPIEFDPMNAGPLSESILLIDNSENVAGFDEGVALSGTTTSGVEGATHFYVTSTTLAPVFAGIPLSVTVTALNNSDQTATAYNGTVSFGSSDPGFVNPGTITLASGTGQATVTLQTVGTQTITATDTTTSDVTGSGSFNVVPPPPVAFTGTAASANFGSQAVGSAESPVTLNFSVAAGTTIGSIGVLTQGAPNLDFAAGAGGTCTAQTFATATTCTVNVTFTPSHPGLRMGAVVFYSEAGNAGTSLGQVLIYGVGTGPQVIFANTTTGMYQPSTTSILGSGVSAFGLAMDGGGNVFVTDGNTKKVYEIVAAGGYTTVKALGGGFGFLDPEGIAIDGAGNVFVSDNENSAVYEIVAAGGYSTVKTIGGALFPSGLAVDGEGNVFIIDGNCESYCAYEFFASDGYTTSMTLGGSGLSAPVDLAVDANGNVFVGNEEGGGVQEIPASCIAGANDASCVLTLVKGLGAYTHVSGVAIDASGNVFFSTYSTSSPTTGTVQEILAAGGYTTTKTIEGGLDLPLGVALDGSGNVFFTGNHEVVTKLDFADPPTLAFQGTTLGVESSDSPQLLTVFNDGNADLTFPVPSDGDNPTMPSGFTLDSTTTCPQLTSSSTAGTLTAGASCNYAVDFMPVVAGTISGSLLLTDESLNASPAVTQAIQLNGTAAVPHLAFTTRPPGTLKAGKAPGTVVVSVENVSNSVVTTSSATITLTVTGPSSYSQTYTATAASGVASFSSLATLNVAGSYTYTATDTADGFTQAVATETVNPAPPFGGITQAVDSVTLSTTVGQADSLLVSGWVADIQDGAPLSNVTVLIDGTSVGTPTLGIANSEVAKTYGTQFLNSGFQMLYAATSLSLGSHNVTVIAIDSGGRSTTFGPSTFTVAAAAGAGSLIGVLGPAEDSVTFSTTVGQSDSVNINGWVFEPGASVPLSNVTVYIDGGSVGAPTLGVARPGVAAQYSSSYLDSGYQLLYPATSLSLGAHNVTVIAVDSGGHSTTFGPVAFTVATAAGPGSPFGTLNPAVDSVTLRTTVSQSDSVNISGWVFDPGNGVAMSSVTVYIDGTSIGAPTMGLARPGVAQIYGSTYRNSGFQMLYPASSLSAGAHVVTVIAIDSGGRSTNLGPVQFTVQ